MSLGYRGTPDWPYHISAGGTVYKVEGGERLYGLLLRGTGKKWAERDQNTYHLPKGTLDPGENLEECAKREIREEAGLDVELKVYLGALHRKFTSPYTNIFSDRTIHYYLAEVLKDHGETDDEHEKLEWFNADEAVSKLEESPKGEEEIIKRAEKYLDKNAS